MNKRKGFTLIELIAVLVVLAIILAIAVPSITGVIKSAKERACVLDAGMMEKAAKTYVQMENVTIENGKSTTISIDTLQASKYLSAVLDPKDRKTPCEGYVIVTNNSGDYSFHASLKCSNTCKSADYDEGLSNTTSPLELDTKIKNGDKYFEGGNPNNWVKFGRMDQNDNRGIMWRIIKIDNTGIKMAYEGIENGASYPLEDGRALIDGSMGVQWDSSGENKWNTPASLVGKLNDWLSQIYVIDMEEYLSAAPWKVGGVPYQDPTTLRTFLTYQDINSTAGGGNFDGLTNYDSVIGTINAVDFMYTSDNEECMYSYKETGSDNECAYNLDGSLNNFLQKDKYHWWTLNARSDVTNRAWHITNSGLIGSSQTNFSAVSVRPVLNLKLDTVFVAGTGTVEDPYILEEYMIGLSDAPKITLNGDETTYIRQYDLYSDAGATAYDEQDGDITSDISATNTVNVSIPGTYTVTYNVSDRDGNEAIPVTRTVVVVERDVPIITLKGDNPTYVTVKGTYTDPGATAYDINYGDISDDVVVTGTVDANTLGTYFIRYNVTNVDGIKAPIVTRKVIVRVPTPVITLNGPNPTLVGIGSSYTEAGYIATDEVDGDITTNVQIRKEKLVGSSWAQVNNIDVDTLGTFRIRYSITNSYGVNAFVYRGVNIVPVNGPEITYTPSNGASSKKEYDVTIGVNKTIHNIDTSSLKYFVYRNDSYLYGDINRYFNTSYRDKDVISLRNATGYYYIYAVAKDVYGNTTMKGAGSYRLDNSAPQISMNSGSNKVLLGSAYVDPGATAYDYYYDGWITSKIVTTSNVNTSVAGLYSVNYEVTDSAGNRTTATRVIEVYIPTPKIFLNGGSRIDLLYGTPYVEPGATATDEIDGDLTNKIQISGAVNHMTEGTYTITYSVTNSQGHTGTRTREVRVYIPDPVININGYNPVRVMIHTPYSDAGATATDTLDGNLTSKIIATGTVNVDVAGRYTITYSVTNNLGKTTTKTRTVEVYVPIPKITILGDNPYTMYKGQIYSDAGATAQDDLDGNLTSSIITTGTVSTMRDGIYPITYTVTNSEGGVGTAIRNVIVKKSTLTVTPIGGNVTLLVGTPYTEQGATAHDEVDGDVTSNIITTGTVNPSVVGNYSVTYSVTNSGGDTKTAVRTVIIRAPIVTLTLNGASTVELPIGTVYSDLGAVATDELLGDVTSRIVSIPNINPNVLGTYYVDYRITTSGVTKTERRTVKVVPLPGPIVSFNSNGDSTWKKQHYTTVTVSKGNYDPDITTYKYLWKTDLITPTEASFIHAFSSGDTIYTPSGATGRYYLFILAKDVLGNVSILGSNGFNVDNIDPVLTLNGLRVVETPVDGTYTELGVTVTETDSGIDSNGIVVTSTIVPGIIGTYSVTYNATDKAGNHAIPVVRTVSVIEASLRDAPGEDFVPLYDADYFVGADPHNWVEFGNAADNVYEYIPMMWRIIKADSTGIKIVYEGAKNEAGTGVVQNGTIGKYQWDDTNNTWNRPANVRTTLTNFFTNMNEENKDTLTKKINWCVGKVSSPYGFDNFKNDACTVMGDELSAIGLVNGKDYILTSKDPCDGYNQASCGSKNFLKKSYSYYTISADSASSTSIFLINSNGGLTRDVVTKNLDIRPVVNLRDDVLILGGEGTFDNPYKLNTRKPLVDNDPPVIDFTPITLQDSTIVKSVEVVVTDDKTGVDKDSLKYVWTTSSTQPNIESVSNNFVNGDRIDLPLESGNYYLWIIAKDRKGNQTISKSGPYLADSTAPVITIIGDSAMNLYVGAIYDDMGATAMDDLDGDLTSSISTTSNVNTLAEGDYVVTYTVSDSNGNTRTVTRTVRVRIQTIFDYEYTGNYQTFVAPFDGYYKIDLWGASGGMCTNAYSNPIHGFGGFTSGKIYLDRGTELYVYVGQKGINASKGPAYSTGMAFNGGGAGHGSGDGDDGGGSGGGASDIRLVKGPWNDSASLKSRIMVAGAGGGAAETDTDIRVAGSGGGLTGVGTIYEWVDCPLTFNLNATQTSGYGFGIGANGLTTSTGSTAGGGGGGGGYYGGLADTNSGYDSGAYSRCTPAVKSYSSGGGGSSYISGYPGSDAINSLGSHTGQPFHYSGKSFTEALMIDGNSDMTSPVGETETGHLGNGYARISYIPGYDKNLSITIIGEQVVSMYEGLSYSDQGATAHDTVEGNLTSRIVSTSNVNVNVPGTYSVTYKVTDSDGNVATTVRIVKVMQTTFDYNFTGNYQTFRAPIDGYYKVQLWGAQGNDPNRNRAYGGKGAYAEGEIYFDQGSVLYVYVGESRSDRSASFNAGTTGGSEIDPGNGGAANGYGGGGATDIRLVSGTWNNFDSLKSRLMVAAGGGGATDYSYPVNGGAGGTLNGLNGINGKYPTLGVPNIPPTGGTQTSGGKASKISATNPSFSNGGNSSPGAFGFGGNGNASWGSGGGGGYYGGGGGGVTPNSVDSGAGGSSYISGYPGCDSISSSSTSSSITQTGEAFHYSSDYFTKATMISGNNTMTSPSGGSETGHSDNGYARIGFVRQADKNLSITVTGSKTITQFKGASYSDAGATAYDTVEGNLTNRITSASNVNVNVPGHYLVTYQVIDSTGNVVNDVRVVNIIETEYNFSYLGEYEMFTVPLNGTYEIELWGAQGNDANRGRSYGGKGAYTQGRIFLEKGTKLYVYVGQSRKDRSASFNAGSTGGISADTNNGGSANGYGGGGATDIRLTSGAWNDATSLRSRIMVAAGGGGGSDYAYPVNGGAGGALTGLNGINGKYPSSGVPNIPPTGATQTNGGTTSVLSASGGVGAAGSFGVGGNGNGQWGSAGGGGYWGGAGGGYTASSVDSGAGGSSYISGFLGCVAVTSSTSNSPKSGCSNGTTDVSCSIHYSGRVFTSSSMISGNNSMPTIIGGTETGHTGNGYAKITHVSN